MLLLGCAAFRLNNVVRTRPDPVAGDSRHKSEPDVRLRAKLIHPFLEYHDAKPPEPASPKRSQDGQTSPQWYRR
jgi:hypothetical protein